MLEIKPITMAKPFETLAETLKEQILSGTIKPGEVINEKDLVDMSGLSRGSVREALRILETQRLVSTRRGRNGGRIALQSSTETLIESMDTYIRGGQLPFSVLIEAVELLEPGIAGLAATNGTEEDHAEMQKALDMLSKTTDRDKFISRNADWHRAIARASHNPILSAVYEALGPGLLDPQVAGFASKKVREEVVLAASRIQEAIIAKDAPLARSRMLKHVLAYRSQVEAEKKK